MNNTSKESNKNALKHAFNETLLQQIGGVITQHFPTFPLDQFLTITPQLETLEMKPRVHLIRDALAHNLPQDYPKALAILLTILNENQLKGFAVWPIAELIQTYGLDDIDLSLDALKIVTTHFTSEWAVRPFIKKSPKKTMAFLLACTQSKNVDVRRWASEGTRPRVPWGERLQAFIDDPSATHDILDALKFDDELFVRKSVANHLNDISKDHPEYIIQLLSRWQQQANNDDQQKIEWITKQALRTLIKKGNPAALALLGVHYGASVNIEQLTLQQSHIQLGESIVFKVKLRSTSSKPQKIVLDYIIHFMKANQQTAPKVFKLRTFELQPYETIIIKKSHAVKKITTRQYYSGEQQIDIQVNGKVVSQQHWFLYVE